MAGKPDLLPKILGLWKDPPDLLLRVEVVNQGTAPAKPFKVRLDLYKFVSPGIVEIFWYCQQTLDWSKVFEGEMPPDGLLATDFRLPVGVKPEDVGPKNMYAVTILGPADESEAANNVIVSDEPLPLLPKASGQGPPEPPPEPWQLSASAIVGKRKSVVAHIKNKSIKPATAKTVQLHLRLPKAGSPTGSPSLSGSAPVPALQPSEEVLVTIVGDRDFIAPQVKIVKNDGIISKKKNLTRKFKTLIPFSLKIKGTPTEVGFGPIAGSPEGQIKFPGKK